MHPMKLKLTLAGACVALAFGGIPVRPAISAPPDGGPAASQTIRPVVDFFDPDVRLCQVLRWNTTIRNLPTNVFFIE